MKNQCDGCRRNLPIENGIHIDKNQKFSKLYMVCEKKKYEDSKSNEPREPIQFQPEL